MSEGTNGVSWEQMVSARFLDDFSSPWRARKRTDAICFILFARPSIADSTDNDDARF